MFLRVIFTNGVKKIYDTKQLFSDFEMFSPIVDNPSLFNNVYVDCGGCGVAWNNEIDISEWELWENGIAEDNETDLEEIEKVGNMYKQAI